MGFLSQHPTGFKTPLNHSQAQVPLSVEEASSSNYILNYNISRYKRDASSIPDNSPGDQIGYTGGTDTPRFYEHGPRCLPGMAN